MPEQKLSVTLTGVATTEDAGAVTRFVTLQDAAGREMRVYIGKSEADALSLGLLEHAPERPGTYEALLACVTAAGSVVEEVVISVLLGGTYYAEAVLRAGDHRRTVDLRPSDALNIAVRTHCPIFVAADFFAASLAPELLADSPVKTVTVVPPTELALTAEEVSAELLRLYTEDQADRRNTPIDWEEVAPCDAVRLARVKQLYHGQALHSGLDYFHVAMVLQHSGSADDHLLAHEFCIVAISLGVESAKWLAAVSEDRFLQNIGRLQRFGTQYQRQADGSYLPGETNPAVEDSLRRALNVPLQAEMNIWND